MQLKTKVFLWLMFAPLCLYAQSRDTLSFKDNWYMQLGVDMSLQNPYGHDFSAVFPNGKTFGVDAAIGRWFTPELGLRAKVNWENGLALMKNNHDNWLAPFNQPGVNRSKGGYLTVTGDVQLDIHNFLYGYDEDRHWNLQVFPRAGLVYNFGVSKGSPLLGFGFGNTYRLNDRYSLYCDVAYNAVSSGFTGVDKKTGLGSNSNGFFDIDLGVQVSLGDWHFPYNIRIQQEKDESNGWQSGFWSNWFLQVGMDMSLQNPYKCNFSHVFPKGKSFGFDAAIGKWFSPEIGIRACVNWENGCPLFRNNQLEWIAPALNGESNMDKGGYVATYADVMLNTNNFFNGYDISRKGSFLVLVRAGLTTNLALDSGSPMVGMGCGYTYRLSDRFSLVSEVAYQVTTSEFYYGVSHTGMKVSSGSNGFMDLQLGLQWDLGK